MRPCGKFLGFRSTGIKKILSLYQFLIAVRQDGSQLTNEAGEVTSHLNGLFYRTLRMVEGKVPVYIQIRTSPFSWAETSLCF